MQTFAFIMLFLNENDNVLISNAVFIVLMGVNLSFLSAFMHQLGRTYYYEFTVKIKKIVDKV